MHEFIHGRIARQTYCVRHMDEERKLSLFLMHTNTHFPTGVVHGSEHLPVITTAIDQSDQRKLEVDWPGCFTEECGCSLTLTLPIISYFSDVLLLLRCYYPLFIPQVLSLSFGLPQCPFQSMSTPPPPPPFLFSLLLFRFMSM